MSTFFGQNLERIKIKGIVFSEENDIEAVTIFNTSSNKGTITNNKGEFELEVALNDVIEIFALQFKPVTITIDEAIIMAKQVKIQLVEKVNQLDEVLVGKVLTGNLASDIKNMEGNPPINFYDVGIPGYTGKIATQSERRLAEAGEFKPKMLLGLLGGGLPLNPILNGISGRTRMLKRRVEIEGRELLIQHIKSKLAKSFFASNPLDDDLQMDFLYFCADDENFIKHCKNQTDFKILIFLRMKYKQYQENRNTTKG